MSQIQKNVALEKRVPRYTSYPPANHFNSSVTAAHMTKWLGAIPQGSRISLYVHIPFCRNLCWFCACRTQGIKRHFTALSHYIDHLKDEIDQIRACLGPGVVMENLHLGGGTPTLLPAALSADLLNHIRQQFNTDDAFDLSVEIDPTEIDQERLEVLAHAGLSRASVGVQDFNPIIQKAIGRRQSFEETRNCFDLLRALDLRSINIDLLYGLPHQTKAGFAATIEKVTGLAPDRVAMFGYAHVPWMARRQQLIDEKTLPDIQARVELLRIGRLRLEADGYMAVGIDHFAKPHDQLVKAARSGQLQRNFQGYTDDQSRYLIGVGASAISRLPQGYAQNASGTQAYLEMITAGTLATRRGHIFSQDDLLYGHIIHRIMCDFEIALDDIRARYGHIANGLCDEIIEQAPAIGLVRIGKSQTYRISGEPHLTARLIARHFDQYKSPATSHSLAV